MKFVHTADWQIGMKAAHAGKAGDRVRSARLDTIRRIQRLAREQNADFVLVAGDTFEDHGVSKRLVGQIGDLLGGFDCPVYVIPGNHDPWIPGGVWDRAQELWSRRIQVLVERSPVPVPGGVLYPCPLTERWSEEDPTAWIPSEPVGEIRVGLAHGSLKSPLWEGQQNHPIAADAAQRSGLDYLALGDWHSVKEIPGPAGIVRMAYSGTPEPTNFGEADSGYVLVVDIEAHGAPPRLERHKVGELSWWNLEAEIREPGDLKRLVKSIQDRRDAGATLVKIKLSGILFAAEADLLEELPELLTQFLYGHIDDSALIAAPADDSWINRLPEGILRQAGERLMRGASKEKNPVAQRALLELYRIANGGAA